MSYKKFLISEWMERLRHIYRESPSAVIDMTYVETLGDRLEASVVSQRDEILMEIRTIKIIIKYRGTVNTPFSYSY
ncbi:Uncharacterized protein FWK35_00025657 [Aphis craccivora]|uniref:Uncharacterized protein n=1 Tax=Aphis craccivora TaxID=307492 RepID=A0A6G0W607_APHCR|nr:Uncharacterized protein FWK35_00025657 [Aphis craccivora]